MVNSKLKTSSHITLYVLSLRPQTKVCDPIYQNQPLCGKVVDGSLFHEMHGKQAGSGFLSMLVPIFHQTNQWIVEEKGLPPVDVSHDLTGVPNALQTTTPSSSATSGQAKSTA